MSADEIGWAARRTLESIAFEQPLALVVEDIHWARPAMLELLDGLVDDAAAPILIVCPARPDLLESSPDWVRPAARRWTVDLEGLPAQAGEELIDATAGGSDVPGWLRERILQTAEGNPLFVEEMVRLIVESGPSAVAVPTTIEALMAARIDQLPRPELTVAQRAAVVGRVFERPTVEALLPVEDRHDLDARLRALLQKDVIRDEPAVAGGDSAFKFRHILIRDAAYNAMAKLERAKLHEAFADWLEQAAAGREIEFAEILGHHLEQAYRYRTELRDTGSHTLEIGARAADHLAAAGRAAFERGDTLATTRLLERTTVLPGLPSETLAEIHLRLSEAYAISGDFTRALDCAERAVTQAQDDRGLSARARVTRLEARELNGLIDNVSSEYIAEMDAAVADAEASGDALAIARTWAARNIPAYLLGRLDESTEQLRRALAAAARTSDVPYQLELENSLLVHELVGPTRASIVVEHGRNLLARTEMLPSLHADALRLTGIAEALLGRLVEGRAMMAQSLALADELRRESDSVNILLDSSWVERLAGDLAAAESLYVKAQSALWRCMTPNREASLLPDYSSSCWPRASSRTRSVLVGDVGEVPQTVNRVRLLCCRARLAAVGTSLALLIDEAFRLIDGSGFVHVWTDALIDAGEAMAALGDFEAARNHLVKALDICDRKENVAFAGQLRARLAELPSAAVS